MLANLLDNAEKYAGGATDVSIELVGEVVQIAIEDRGNGVPEAEREVIFDRFSRGSESGNRASDSGVGLGLALVDEHVRLHGGQVWVEDRRDGATRRPVRRRAAGGAAPVGRRRRGAARGRHRDAGQHDASRRVERAVNTGGPDAPRPRRRHVVATSVVLAVVGLVVVACGIPTDHSPRLLDRHDMPAALSAGTTTTQLHGSGGFQSLKIYLVRTTPTRTVLQPVTVEVAEKSTIVSQAEAVLAVLIADQPSSRPATASLTNAIPSNLRILDASLDGNVLELDLSHLDSTVVSLQQKLAFAEIVFTLTELNGIDAVKFSIVGQPAQVPLDSGTSPAGAAIDAGSYPQL